MDLMLDEGEELAPLVLVVDAGTAASRCGRRGNAPHPDGASEGRNDAAEEGTDERFAFRSRVAAGAASFRHESRAQAIVRARPVASAGRRRRARATRGLYHQP
jgi:hypothetical protein